MSNTQNTTNFTRIGIGAVGIAFFLSAMPASSRLADSVTHQEINTRIIHAQEILGQNFSASLPQVHDSREWALNLESYIHARVRTALPSKFQPKADDVAQTILDEARRYQFDPFFLMAVISHESRFNPRVLGSHGEIGLMQVLPETAEWISRKFDLPWKDSSTLTDPSSNIRIGAAYLSYLRERFRSHGQLYVAAYNMGATNVQRVLSRNLMPREYHSHVVKQYIQFYQEIKDAREAADKKAAGVVAHNI